MSEKYLGRLKDDPGVSKRKSGITRFIGGTEKEKEEACEFFQNIFENNKLDDYEREKTKEELEIIEMINNRARETVLQYGGNPLLINAENIHIIDKNKVTEEEVKRAVERFGLDETAFYDGHRIQGIVIMPNGQTNNLELAQVILHEILHFNSFQSIRIVDNKYKKSRIGFQIYTKTGDKYFEDFDEAVIEELVIRIDHHFFKDEEALRGDILKKTRFLDEYEIPDDKINEIAYVFDKVDENGNTSGWHGFYSRLEERRKLNRLIDEIYKRNKDKFTKKEDIFDIFAKVVFSGKILELARLIESTFGKGSFRELGSAKK